MSRFRAAIIGTGKIAGILAAPDGDRPATHAGVMVAQGIELAAVCETDSCRAAEFSARWRAGAVLSDVSELARLPRLDLVAIATPDATHAALLTALLTLPAPPRLIICEKPLCTSKSQLGLLRQLMATTNSMVVVNHSRRFDARHRRAREIIVSGTLGRLMEVHWVYYGGWMHNGVHALDTIRMLLDCSLEVRSVELGIADRAGDPNLDVAFSAIEHPGARIRIESFPETAYQLFEGELRFESGRIRLLDFGVEVLIDQVAVNNAGERELKTMEVVAGQPETAMQALYREATLWLEGLPADLDRRAGFSQAAATMDLLFAAQERGQA